jgi:hypothetical protein
MVETIYRNIYGEIHAKTCKVKRNIALLCLKADNNSEALNELTLFGENSTQLGKTYKVIGTIHLLNQNMIDAKDYLINA